MLVPFAVLRLHKLCAHFSQKYPTIMGVLFERVAGRQCRAVATDGIMLVVAEWDETKAAAVSAKLVALPFDSPLEPLRVVVDRKLLRTICHTVHAGRAGP